ncbi:MAG: carboxypeptidase-like regulatory domain-containing protein, partial [Duncaniella sp.]|nr:carboxypeptidase-like regulatory domain-containing protein [Duncaniella sp.]
LVTSESDGEPLIGRSVRVKGTSDGVATDMEGRYTLSASKGDVLIFSYIGYTTKEITVEKSVIDVVMKDDNLRLDDVVVVGYGTMKRSDITGSVVSVGADDIKNQSLHPLTRHSRDVPPVCR